MRAGEERPPLLWQRLVIALGIALLGAGYLTTLRAGQPWGDDFAMYILQARDIAEGHWFGPTGYIYNPHLPKIGPPSYPPLFPMLLAPVYAAWGLNLTPMKLEVILFFLGALYLVFEFAMRQTTFPFAAGIVAALGLSPYFWEIKESVVSDLPFLFFTMLALCVIAACDRRGWQSTAGAIGAAACVYLCFATRTIGVALLASLLVCALPRRGQLRWKAVLAGAVAAALIAVHSLIFRGAGSYLDQLHAPWQALPHNLMAYFWNLRNVFFGVGGGLFGWLFLFVLMMGGFLGLALRLRQRVSPIDAFTLAYALVVLLWSSEEDPRLLIPLIPFWFLYLTVALRQLPGHAGLYIGTVLLAIMVCGYAACFSRIPAGPIRSGLGDPIFLQVCRYINSQTPPGSVFVFAKPRLLALATRHQAAAYHQPPTDGELWNYFRTIGVRYVLVNREFEDDRAFLEPLLLRRPSAVQPIYGQGTFELYQLRQ